MNIESDNKDSAPISLGEIIEEYNINAIAFDLDNTLLDTNTYYIESWKRLAGKMGISQEEFSKALHQNYIDNNRKPVDIVEQALSALEIMKGSESLDYLQIEKVCNHFKNFYNDIPILFPNASELIHNLYTSDISVVFCSHAQEDWTKLKVNALSDGLPTPLPYLAIPIDEEKDSESWRESLCLSGYGTEESLVVGDNFNADILPAIEAGCGCVVWIDSERKGLSNDIQIPDDVEIIVVNDLGQLCF